MKHKAILLVDDEQMILDAVSVELKQKYSTVTAVSNGEMAVSELRDGHYNLVITDLMMEGMGGIQVLKEAKIIDPDLCVIIMTGFGDMTSAIEALRLGADDYLLKPCDTDELLLRMDYCLSKQELSQKVKLYEDILPICSVCKSVRDDRGTEPGQGEWQPLEDYLLSSAKVRTSHTYCPSCYKEAIDQIR